MLKYILSFFLFAVIALPFAHAQEKTDTTLEGLENTVKILTRPLASVQVPMNEPIELGLGIVDVPGLNKSEAEGINLTGYVRYVEYEGKKIGQAVLSGVKKGDNEVSLDTTAFSSQFDIEGDDAGVNLQTTDTISIEGNADILIQAVKKLNEASTLAEAEAPEKEINNTGSPSEPAQGTSASGDTGNDQAAAYQTPERATLSADVTTDTRITTDGCKIIPDYAQEVAIQQNKVQTFENGALVSDGKCESSLTKYPLKKNYALCDNEVNYDTLKVTEAYQYYFVDPDTLTATPIGECKTDSDPLDIRGEYNCTIFTDFDKELAYKQVELGYIGARGYQKLRDCVKSPFDEPVAMKLQISDCNIIDDFGAGFSIQQLAWSYEMDGLTYKATQCFDSEDATHKYTHEKVFYNGGKLVCEGLKSSTQITLQYKTYITINGIQTLRRDCTPDNQQLALSVATDGCMNPALWQHDLEGGVSYGQQRYYYLKDGAPYYVSECLKSDKVYKHKQKTNRWDYHDKELYAYEYIDTYIEDASFPNGTYDVKINHLPTGAQQQIYLFSANQTDLTGNSTYDGCQAWRETANMEVYTRPDETIYERIVSVGIPKDGGYVCQVAGLPVWEKISDVIKVQAMAPVVSGPALMARKTRVASYLGKRTLSREDGKLINQTSSTTHNVYLAGAEMQVSWAGGSAIYHINGSSGTWYFIDSYPNVWGGWSYWINPAYVNMLKPPSEHPHTYTGAEVYSWNQAEGW